MQSINSNLLPYLYIFISCFCEQGSLDDEEDHAGIVPRAVKHLGLGIAKHTAQHGATFKVGAEKKRKITQAEKHSLHQL
jgi:hypothetical protein